MIHCRKLLFILVLAAMPGLFVKADSGAVKKPNILLICVDDLRPELACFGQTYIHSPNIDALASRGRSFNRHYVQAPTCGASRYALLTGQYGPYGNGALFQRGRSLANAGNGDRVTPSLPTWFRQSGYTTVSVGKVSHHPGGRGGSDWDDAGDIEMPESWDRHLLPAGPWLHPRGAMHGLANGEIRGDASKMDLFQAVSGPDEIYPDGLIVEESIRQLRKVTADNKPFFLAVGIIRPHLPFGAPSQYLEIYSDREDQLPGITYPSKPEGKTTWHRSGEFMKYNRWGKNPNEDADFARQVRLHYAACVSYADALVGRLLDELNRLGQESNTIVALWGDHGWHLGEHAIWGKHSLFEESLRSPLIISVPGIEAPGETSTAVVETIDIFPTLCHLAGLEIPDNLHGQSLKPILDNPEMPGHPAISYTSESTIRTDRFRLIAHRDGHFELYDHASPELETSNLAASRPALVKELHEALLQRLALRDKR